MRRGTEAEENHAIWRQLDLNIAETEHDHASSAGSAEAFAPYRALMPLIFDVAETMAKASAAPYQKLKRYAPSLLPHRSIAPLPLADASLRGAGSWTSARSCPPTCASTRRTRPRPRPPSRPSRSRLRHVCIAGPSLRRAHPHSAALPVASPCAHTPRDAAPHRSVPQCSLHLPSGLYHHLLTSSHSTMPAAPRPSWPSLTISPSRAGGMATP